MLKYFLFFSLVLIAVPRVNSQCPAVNFSLPGQVCLESNFLVENTTTAAFFEWDLCPVDLDQVPALSTSSNLTGASSTIDLTIVEDGSNVFGFAVDQNSQSIIRINFNGNIDNDPVSTNLGNPGNFLSNPNAVSIVKEGNNWFGLVANSGDNKIILLNFGSSLENSPASSVLLTRNSSGFVSLEVVSTPASNNTLVIAEYNSQSVTTVNFPQGFLFPGTAPLTQVVAGSRPIDVQVIQECASWFVVVLSFDDKKLYRLEYGTSLSSVPAITVYPLTLSFQPYRLSLVREGDTYHGFVSSVSDGDGFHRLDFGNDLTNTPAVALLGAFGVLQNSRSLWVDSYQGKWRAFLVNFSDGNLFRFIFDGNCGVTPLFSSSPTPGIISYDQPGSQKIVLTAFQADGTISVGAQQLTVTNQQAPDYTIEITNSCANHNVLFQADPNGTLVDYQWDFGNGNSSTQATPVNTYSSAGTFTTTLAVVASNSCTNIKSLEVTIFNEPQSSFTSPAVSPICTNQQFNFDNTSTFDAGSGPTWTWKVNGLEVSTSADLLYAFSNVQPHAIKLIVAIPGCENEVTTVISDLVEGPFTDFSFQGICLGTPTQFTNQAQGAITGYLWDFGDTQTSTEISPSYQYLLPGPNDITLTSVALNGCNTTSTKTVTIYTRPQVDFTLDLPPFSCAKTPSQFHDLTPPPSDSNLQEWDWSFGDGSNAVAKDPTHTYVVEGPYQVDLSVTTDRGCSNTIQKQISIAPSPAADFSFDDACVNQASHFVDASGTNVKAWQWEINNSTYFSQNPAHTFLAPGSYNAQLTATGNNNCVGVVSKTLVVPVVPTMGFITENPCLAQEAVFTDQTLSANDPVVKWDWEFGNPASTASGSSTKHVFSATGVFPVELSIESQAGCKYTLTKNIIIYNVPQAGFDVSEESGPPPLNIQFTNTTAGASAYTWRFNDQLNSTTTEPSPDFTFDTLGEYIVDLVATNDKGCSDLFSRTISIIVPHTELAMEEFTLATDQMTGKVRSVLRIRNNSNYRIHTFDVVVDLGSQILLTETVNLSIAAGGVDSFVLANELVQMPTSPGYICANLNIDDDEKVDNNKKCIAFGEEHILFHPFPNPSQGLVTVQLITSSDEVVKIRVVNAVGAKVYDKVVQGFKGLNSWLLDLTNSNPGIYLVLVETASQSMTYRILIQ